MYGNTKLTMVSTLPILCVYEKPKVNLFLSRNLAENMYPVLPTKGLENLKNLKTFNNKELKDFPPAETFPRIQLLTLSYAYHCCEFIHHEEEVRTSSVVVHKFNLLIH